MKDKALASLDDLLVTGRILLENLKGADKDNGDGAAEAISVMLMQLVNAYGPHHQVTQHLFPALNTIRARIDGTNYVGAIWDAESLIESLKEIRRLVESA